MAIVLKTSAPMVNAKRELVCRPLFQKGLSLSVLSSSVTSLTHFHSVTHIGTTQCFPGLRAPFWRHRDMTIGVSKVYFVIGIICW